MAEPLTGRIIGDSSGRAIVDAGRGARAAFGMALHCGCCRPAFEPGMAFSVKKLLRFAIALLGLRIALGDIVALGLGHGFHRGGRDGRSRSSAAWPVRPAVRTRGGLRGAGWRCDGGVRRVRRPRDSDRPAGIQDQRDADTVFTVVAVNALSTVAMVAYPRSAPFRL